MLNPHRRQRMVRQEAVELFPGKRFTLAPAIKTVKQHVARKPQAFRQMLPINPAPGPNLSNIAPIPVRRIKALPPPISGTSNRANRSAGRHIHASMD